jgi:hypothetical protein
MMTTQNHKCNRMMANRDQKCHSVMTTQEPRGIE